MEYFLVRLADAPVDWSGTVESTTSFDARLAPVRKKLRHYGGSLPLSGSFDTEHLKGIPTPPDAVTGEFVMWSGHDPLTAVATPDHEAGYTINTAISAKTGLDIPGLNSLVAMQDAVEAMAAAKAAVAFMGHAVTDRAKP